MKIERVLLSASVITTLVGCASPVTTDQQLVERGYQHILSQQWGQAETALLRALEADANNPYALMNLGLVYERTDRDAEAMEMYNRVIESQKAGRATGSHRSNQPGTPLTIQAERNLRLLRYRTSRL